VNIKIAGEWMVIPLKMVLIGIVPYPYQNHSKIISKPQKPWTFSENLGP
jgi:hypothetical protein